MCGCVVIKLFPSSNFLFEPGSLRYQTNAAGKQPGRLACSLVLDQPSKNGSYCILLPIPFQSSDVKS